MKHIKEAMRGVSFVEAEIEMLLVYMDYHLRLLATAIKEGNEQSKQLQENKLSFIRTRLFELEYFAYNPY